MRIFPNRKEAGKRLAAALQKYKNSKDTVVIGLPRGGVVPAYEVAQSLHLPLDVIFPKKVGAPHNPELAIGAVTETGEGFFNQDLVDLLDLPPQYLAAAIEEERQAARSRLQVYRKKHAKVPLAGKKVLLVDDGLATGATMKASIRAVRAEGAKEILVAVPVSPADTLEEIREMSDEAIALETPRDFYAVGQFYEEFLGVEDETVLQLLEQARSSHG